MSLKIYLFWFVIFCIIYILRLRAEVSRQTYELKPNTNVKICEKITANPREVGNSQIFKLGGFWVKTHRFPEYYYNQTLCLVGRLERKVTNSLYSEFWLIYPEIKKVKNEELLVKSKEGVERKFITILLFFRRGAEQVIDQTLPEPASSLLAGIVLGSQRPIPEQFWRSLRSTGTLHIIVASGMNVTYLLIGALNFFLLIFPRKIALFSLFPLILLYCLLVGGQPPIIRAGLMGGFSLLAMLLGKPSDGLLGLFFSVVLMLLLSPLLLFDLSFQLSFASTAGIFFFVPFLERAFPQKGIFNFLKKEFLETLSAQVATAPLLIKNFSSFNLVSLLPNVLVLWLVPYLMIFGTFQILLGLYLPLAQLIAYILYMPLLYFVNVIHLFGHFDIFNLNFGEISWWVVGGYYVSLISLILLCRTELGFGKSKEE